MRPVDLMCIAATALLCSACHREKSDGATPARRIDEAGRVVLTPKEENALGLETKPAAKGVVMMTHVRFGKIVARPSDDMTIIAPVGGRLAPASVAIGAHVSAGDVVTAIEPLVDAASRVSLESQRREMSGQIEGARAQIDAKRAELNRVTALVETGLATDADRARAQADVATEEARAKSLQRAGNELGRAGGGQLPLRAPIAGVVALLATDVGTWMQQGSPVARIVQSGPRWIDVAMAPSDPVGTRYRAHTSSGDVPARLGNKGVVVADGVRRDRLETEQSSDVLMPGETVSVDVLTDVSGIVVASDAVVRTSRAHLVFVRREAGRYEPRRVDVAAEGEGSVALGSGVAEGDQIVVRGAGALLGEVDEKKIANGVDGGAQ